MNSRAEYYHQLITLPGLPLRTNKAAGPGCFEPEMSAVMAVANDKPQEFQANVLSVTPVSHDVYRVELELPRRQELTFSAGQYLAINLPDSGPCFFSIASSPTRQNIELHIQASPDWASGQKVVDALAVGAEVNLTVPYGKACVTNAPDKPLLLIAAGTGFAQMKSLVEFFQDMSVDVPVKLFWGVRRPEDMYLRPMASQWAKDWPGFTFQPVVGDDPDNDWNGHHAQLVRAVLASGADLKNVEVHASGSPAMVYALMDALVEAGLPPETFFSDVLEYAPRK